MSDQQPFAGVFVEVTGDGRYRVLDMRYMDDGSDDGLEVGCVEGLEMAIGLARGWAENAHFWPVPPRRKAAFAAISSGMPAKAAFLAAE